MDGTQGEWNDKTRPENRVNRCQQNTGLSVARHVHPHSTPSFGPKGLFWGPESNGYAFLGAGVQWICFFGARSPMDMLFWDTRKPRDLPLDMLFWGPESNGYAFLGYQKTKGFATSTLDLLTDTCGSPRSKKQCVNTTLPRHSHWICFFGARSPLDMLFCDTRKPRDLPLDMLFWGPESNFLYLYVPSYNL